MGLGGCGRECWDSDRGDWGWRVGGDIGGVEEEETIAAEIERTPVFVSFQN